MLSTIHRSLQYWHWHCFSWDAFLFDSLLLKEMWWANVGSECVLWHVQQQMLSTFWANLWQTIIFTSTSITPPFGHQIVEGKHTGCIFSFFEDVAFQIAGLANDMTCSLILWLNLISIHSFETPVFVWWLNHLNHQTVDRMNVIATFTWAHPVEKKYEQNINFLKSSVRPTTRSNKKSQLHPGPRWKYH